MAPESQSKTDRTVIQPDRVKVCYDYLRQRPGDIIPLDELVVDLFADEADRDGYKATAGRVSSSVSILIRSDLPVERIGRGRYRFLPPEHANDKKDSRQESMRRGSEAIEQDEAPRESAPSVDSDLPVIIGKTAAGDFVARCSDGFLIILWERI